MSAKTGGRVLHLPARTNRCATLSVSTCKLFRGDWQLPGAVSLSSPGLHLHLLVAARGNLRVKSSHLDHHLDPSSQVALVKSMVLSKPPFAHHVRCKGLHCSCMALQNCFPSRSRRPPLTYPGLTHLNSPDLMITTPPLIPVCQTQMGFATLCIAMLAKNSPHNQLACFLPSPCSISLSHPPIP